VTPGTVFLGTDFSPASENAFLLALDEARLRSKVLVIAHVIPTAGCASKCSSSRT